ncbi:AmmeMemoRadiSam system radical SAM enzyme [Candidatus Pacearchaeota archaeon]|nr:MAG: AmmeMemoRadiSam system radical SAM enzyme [Candidatus Pacearchaeota archaeon]
MKECVLYKKLKEKKVQCIACAHRCYIDEGNVGICRVRENIKGRLYLLVYGKVISKNIDPIEKKPLYRFLPGSFSYSIGTIGCNFKCDFCQNYDISQLKKILGESIKPEEVVEETIKTGCKSISYTYNEPTIFIEFVKDIARLAKKKGLKNVLVTNGYMTKECLDFIASYIDAMNIDLKSFNNEFYLKICKAKLKPVLETIKRVYEKGIHLEITTLIIPGENDSEKEFENIAKFIASIDKNIPWHISRFFPMYKMEDKEPTSLKILKKAEEIGKKYLKYVYIGNV